MAQPSIVVSRKQISLIFMPGQFLSLWHRAGVLVSLSVAVGLTALLLLLPLSAVVTSLLRGPRGIHTTSSSSQLSEVCEDSSLDDDILSFTFPWQLVAKAENVGGHRFSALLAFDLLTLNLPTIEQAGVRAISHGRAPPLPQVTCIV